MLLDYDGTLTPINQTPSAALLGLEAERILQQMAHLPGMQVVIVTGRSMEDIRRLVPIENMGFVANHGFHTYKDGTEWIHPQALSLIQALSRLHSILRTTLARFPKVDVENKQFTLSIHYRNVAQHNAHSLKSVVLKTVHAFDPTLRITRGKRVFEVRPNIAWGKGDAVLKMLNANKAHRRTIPVFIGDDATDEDVFRSLRYKGITIRVGNSKSTLAQYYVKNVEDVMRLLRSIIRFQMNRSLCSHSCKMRKEKPYAHIGRL
jgi:alpha,alpha-trehalase